MFQDEMVREQRRREVRTAQHDGDMEGLARSTDMDAMMQAYVDGNMTTAEMKVHLDRKYSASAVRR